MYKLLEHWDINALIDINKRDGSVEGLPEDTSLDKTAHPLCRAGLRMCSWGYDKNKDAQKFRCPLACDRVQECPCCTECRKSSYGRTVYIKNGFIRVLRGTVNNAKPYTVNVPPVNA